ncbi:MAG TPA: outer membrane beta-barrel protein [Saprospiraceae bacterium]|nr:outer membrane beta-barrel protein [Saprospiraceae bacterium]
MMTTFCNRLLLLAAFTLSVVQAYSQSAVFGQIISEKGEPLEFINVLLLNAADSAIVKMELSDALGKYAFRQVAPGEYRVKTSGLGYSDLLSASFSVAKGEDATVPVMRMAIAAEVLQTIEVVARRPLLEQQAGKLVVNVEDNITGLGGSVTDVLRKVPGLLVINDRVQMAGKSGVTILIDGRPTKYMDVESLLRDMPADNIARIEVVSQPGAAFDAEGTGGVINIVLKKNALLGTNGQIMLGMGRGELWKYRGNASINHRSGPWNLTAGAGYNHNTFIERLDLVRRLPNQHFVQSAYTPGNPVSKSLRLGADYDINDRHRVGITMNTVYSTNRRTGENTTYVTTPEGAELSRFTTLNVQDRNWRSYSGDAFYRWKIDTSGQEFSMDYNYAYYRRRVQSDLLTTGADFEDRRNVEPADTRIFAAQADYKRPLSKYWQLQAGAKISTTRLDNKLLASLMQNGEWVNDALRTNTFLYDEDIYAGYTNLTFNREKLQANIGLRYEDSQAVGFSETLDSTVNLRIKRFFPSLSVSAPLGGSLGWSAAYSYRIKRPGYYDLNPFIQYLDPLTSDKGNPFLVPELTHSGQLSLTFDKQPFFNLSYDVTRNALTEVIEQNDETGEAFKTNVNLDKYTRYGGSLFFPLDFIAKSISGYGGVMVYYHDYRAEYLNADFLQNQWSATGFLQVNATLPKGWKAELSGWIQSPGIDGIMRHETMYGVSAGLQKELFEKRLRLQLNAEGIVQKFFNARVDYANLDFDILSQWEAPVVNLRATWKFGNQHLKNRDNRDSSSSSEQRRLNN